MRCGRIILAAATFLITAGSALSCKSAAEGCQSDSDCKGTRLCDRGNCVESLTRISSAASPPGPAGASPPSGASRPPSAAACAPCATQEDFDRAQKKGQRCCPVTACTSDSQCQAGRVCCRIPDGQLCADAGRCAKADRGLPRVEHASAGARRTLRPERPDIRRALGHRRPPNQYLEQTPGGPMSTRGWILTLVAVAGGTGCSAAPDTEAAKTALMDADRAFFKATATAWSSG